MKRPIVFALCCALWTILDAGEVEGKCTARRVYKLDVIKSSDAGPGDKVLRSTSGQDLGCAITTKKDDAHLCEGADGNAHLFQIKVHNRCNQAVDAQVVVSATGPDAIEFTDDESCKQAQTAQGYTKSLDPNRMAMVLCTTKNYPKEEGSTGPDYSGSYSIDVLAVAGQEVGDGLFDPRIAVERDGDVTTSFPWWAKVFAGVAALAVGALIGWLVGRRQSRSSAKPTVT
ncbi:hypothetical protein TBR22_A04000 [Luteitalea sp. TBR-22]|nr:hypothetical protein TBR22_A04000 [Luteitalea sp. TBR-22]